MLPARNEIKGEGPGAGIHMNHHLAFLVFSPSKDLAKRLTDFFLRLSAGTPKPRYYDYI
ncbi:unnamed protein product [Periconia digitata]|uniref:Uncharacterized protein n=1 Tax=Periconia digitata TaxID=1303443 RepID=A0A9W4UKV6_9PLEO|nr:unnamed protein product [Periconia digitata]